MKDIFVYQKPSPEQVSLMENLTVLFRGIHAYLLEDVPASTERETAIERLRECRMWANAAIVLAED